MFSRWTTNSKAGPMAAGRGAPIGPGARGWPWEPDQSVAAELAIGSLTKFFPKSLGKNGRLQVETLYCTVGALTGFAAQHAVRQECIASGKTEEAEVFAIAEAPNGERYYFGDRLNAVLIPETLESVAAWSVLAGEALRLGAPEEKLPDCLEIFERTAKSIGSPDFGVPLVPPGHEPFLMPRRAVEIFWPSVLNVFTREPVVPVPGFKLVGSRHWPLLLAKVGASYMSATKQSLAPATAVQVFMEAAIPMSKIDQSAIHFVGAMKH
jgi:hypothetical protein